MGPTQLTPRRAKFANEYVATGNATKAAAAAGYSPRTAYAQGSRLLTNVDIAEATHKRRAPVAERTEVSAARVVEHLWSVAHAVRGTAVGVRAAELVGKHLGMFAGRPLDEPAIPDTTAMRQPGLSTGQLRWLVANWDQVASGRVVIEGEMRELPAI